MKTIIVKAPPDSDSIKSEMNFRSQDDFLYPDYSLYMSWYILKHNGIECDIFEPYALKNKELSSVFENAGDFKSACFLGNFYNYESTLEAARFLREKYQGIRIIAIGEFPVNTEEILNNTIFDAVIRGEWDKTLHPLLKSIVKKGTASLTTPGVTWMHKGTIHANPDSKPMTDTEVEHLPFAEYELLPENIYKALSLETSRGNPYYNIFSPSRYGKVWRYISPMGILERIAKCEKFNDRVKEKYIVIPDEYFTGCDKRIHDLAKEIKKKNLEISLHYRSRCSDLMVESLTQNLPAFTGKIILEPMCGYNRGLRKIKKGFDTFIISESARILKKCGIAEKSLYCFVTGFEWESESEKKKTIDFAEKLKDQYGVNTLIEDYMDLSAQSKITKD